MNNEILLRGFYYVNLSQTSYDKYICKLGELSYDTYVNRCAYYYKTNMSGRYILEYLK